MLSVQHKGIRKILTVVEIGCGLPLESGNSYSIAVNTSDEITRIGNVLKYIHGHSPNINDRLKQANSVTPSRDRHADTQVTAEHACATALRLRVSPTD